MSNLRTISLILILFIVAGLVSFISYPCVALPTLPKAKIAEVKVTTYRFYAEYIAFKVKVCVEKDSPAPLDGFVLKVCIIRPYGLAFNHPNDTTLYPGQCGVCLAVSPVTVDEAKKAGTLEYVILLVTKDNHVLDVKKGTFKAEEVGERSYPKARIDEVKPTIYEEDGYKRVTFNVKICVEKNSPMPLDGFYITISLRKPDGELIFDWYTVNDKINPGECRYYTFKHRAVVNQAETLEYLIILHTKDKQHVLDIKKGTFEVKEVTPAPPVAEIEVLDIVGYATTALMICAGLAFILGRMR